MSPRFLSFLLLSSSLLWLTVLTGCQNVPSGRSAVNEVTIRGADKVDEDDIEDKIATTSSSKFLGLFRGVIYEYSTFDRNVLQRDLARVEAFYRSKGFYEAHARAGRIHQIDNNHVRVEIVVEEGKPVLVRSVRLEGLEDRGGNANPDVPSEIVRVAQRSAEATLKIGAPFEEENFDKAVGAVRRSLTDRGYAFAKVKNDAAVDIVSHEVDVVLTVTPGIPCVFGPVTIEGLGSIPEKPVRRAVDIKEGAFYTEAALDSAQQTLLDFGVFSSVEIRPDLGGGNGGNGTGNGNGNGNDGNGTPERKDPAGRGIVPIKVKVEPSRLRTIQLGGGFELDSLKADIHGIAGWEHRNFFGGLRSFSVNFKPGIVFYPTRINNLVFPNKFLLEERLRLELRQPGLIEARTNGFIRPELHIQPFLVDPNPPPDARVIGYGEARNAIGFDRTTWKLFAAISHNLQVAYPFAYVGTKDPTLGTLVISYPELITQLDFRNNRVQPRRGIWIGNTVQVAGGIFGGQAKDVKIQPDLRVYVPLAKHVVLAMRGSVGFLWASSYGAAIQSPNAAGSLFEASEARTRDYQLTFFRGFFSGGSTSNRGYPFRGVGPHDIVPFISPTVALQSIGQTCGGEFDCRTPTGGFTLWEASTEVRIDITGPLSFVTFCDASDVSPREMDLRFDHLHLSCGPGVRYDTPVGPIRLDIGYRLPGLQVIGGLTPDERQPDTFPFGIPIAVALGIGEAF